MRLMTASGSADAGIETNLGMSVANTLQGAAVMEVDARRAEGLFAAGTGNEQLCSSAPHLKLPSEREPLRNCRRSRDDRTSQHGSHDDNASNMSAESAGLRVVKHPTNTSSTALRNSTEPAGSGPSRCWMRSVHCGTAGC